MIGAVGAFIVAGLVAVAWFGGQSYSDRELEHWQTRYSAEVHANLERSIGNLAKPEYAEDPMQPTPEKSFAAERPNLFAGLLAVGVGIVGTVVVLLFYIAGALSRRPVFA